MKATGVVRRIDILARVFIQIYIIITLIIIEGDPV